MSYCRWSCEGGLSDVYCYKSVYDTFVIEIATKRPKIKLPNYDLSSDEAFKKSYEKRLELAKHREFYDLDLPLAGSTFILNTPQGCYNKLIELKQSGYFVPNHALEGLKEDFPEIK